MAVAGLTPSDQLRRPVSPDVVHRRIRRSRPGSVLFGMRSSSIQPSHSPEPILESRRRRSSLLSLDIDVHAALDGIDHEASSLSQQLSELSSHDGFLTVRSTEPRRSALARPSHRPRCDPLPSRHWPTALSTLTIRVTASERRMGRRWTESTIIPATRSLAGPHLHWQSGLPIS
jgi:hypothetical protein